MRQSKSPGRQPRQCGAQHWAGDARRQADERAQRAASWAEPASARRSGARGRGRGPGGTDRRGRCDRATPRCRAPHRRGAGRRPAHPPRAHADRDRRLRRRRSHRPVDAARPLRAAGAVATKICDQGVRFAGAPGRAAATARSMGRGRRRREAAWALAERTRFRRDTRPVGRGRRRGEAERTLAEQTRFRPGTPSTRCRRRLSPRSPAERTRFQRRACAHVCLARSREFDYRPRQ